MNRVKDMLQAGQTAIGTTAGPESEVRFLAGSGFDFLLFDTQHAPTEIKQLGPAVRAMRGREAIPVIRVGDNRPDQICYALDQGAKGLVVPMVNNPDQAKQMVSWCKYPFEGERSSSGVHGEWGEYDDYRAYMDAVNEQLLILPMLETVESLESVDEIAAVDGVDVLLIGPSDLSINLDVALDYTHQKYLDALEKIGNAARNAGKVAGMFFVPPGLSPAELENLGFRFFTLPWQPWAKAGVESGLKELR
jgi:4-hydroxy-2-oxoheptanedioate aldolase